MKFLLDTDILVDFFNDQEYANQLIPDLVNKAPIFISAITVAELRAGFTPEQAVFFLPKLYDLGTILDLNRKIAELGGKLRFEYGRSITDCLIAATAIYEKCQLLTRNKKDFPMPGIKLYPVEK